MARQVKHMNDLKVGHGRECITPPLGIRMVGYAARTDGAAEVHDDLFVNAVVLEGGDQKVAILAYDICLFRTEMAGMGKSLIEEATGLRPEQVLLNTSHTHAGPALGGRDEPREDEENYRAEVLQKSLRALRTALAGTAPAVFSAGSAPVDIGCNRRERQEDGTIKLGHNPDGPSLPEMTVWRFARSQMPDVVLFSTPMHGTTLGGENLSISAEWMGLAVHYIEAASPDVRAVFLQGCGGDQDPYYSLDTGARGTFQEVEQHGRDAAAAVGKALEGTRQLDPLPLRTVLREVALPDKEDASERRAMPIHGLRIGDAMLVALGCEAFVEFALFGRATSAADETLLLAYSNGNVGYLCTADAFETGGYEPSTSRVAPQSEQIAKQAIREVFAALAD
ncbi:MAG: hypothetical protein KAX19_12085 [Candidatus Brocadiae bacterium]|nr:hypothetical protein [Candidatus Brocadiia bacterium]